MDRRAAKELLHLAGWLQRVEDHVVNRNLTWLTLSVDLPQWGEAFGPLFAEAKMAVARGVEHPDR